MLVGTYYIEYLIDDEKVYGFIEITSEEFINNHGLYYDTAKSKTYRKPYQTESYSYKIDKNLLIVFDHTGSYEVEKLKLFKTETISKNPTYKIKINTKNGEVVLTNTDNTQVYRKVTQPNK